MIVSWVMSILAVVILSIVADLLLSGKRMGKFVRGVFASLTILIIVAPLPDIFSGKSGLGDAFYVENEQTNEVFLEYANSLRVSTLCKATEDKLDAEGYKGTEVDIACEWGSEIKITTVTVNLHNLVMDEKVVHINKYSAVTGIVSEYLGVDKGVVVIYD
ncbi:MAG: hypothetical protein IKC48_02100 [Clostridia bacterium]|nr:hypothetical protein [Clostridia bacterium]